MTTTEIRRCDQLHEDWSLYPRMKVDHEHVDMLAEAIRSGVELPPIVIDGKGRVIDGVHRRRATMASSEAAVISCEVRTYGRERDAFLDAVRLNSRHGRTLTTGDRVKALQRAREMRIEPAEIATLLSMTASAATQMLAPRNITVSAPKARRGNFESAPSPPSPRSADVARREGAAGATGHVNAVIGLIEADAIDPNNKVLMDRLRQLYGLLDAWLAEVSS